MPIFPRAVPLVYGTWGATATSPPKHGGKWSYAFFPGGAFMWTPRFFLIDVAAPFSLPYRGFLSSGLIPCATTFQYNVRFWAEIFSRLAVPYLSWVVRPLRSPLPRPTPSAARLLPRYPLLAYVTSPPGSLVASPSLPARGTPSNFPFAGVSLSRVTALWNTLLRRSLTVRPPHAPFPFFFESAPRHPPAHCRRRLTSPALFPSGTLFEVPVHVARCLAPGPGSVPSLLFFPLSSNLPNSVQTT